MFGLGVGPTPVELTWQAGALDFAWMDQRPPEYRAPVSRADVIRATGIDPSAIDATGLPIEEISCGVPFTFVPVHARGLDAAEPTSRDAAAEERVPGDHVGVFVFTTEAAEAASPPTADVCPRSGIAKIRPLAAPVVRLAVTVKHGLVRRITCRTW